MKVFISWSGERSLLIARALRDWLPRVIQAVQPWMSESDIGKGTRWEQEIGIELSQTKFGIICLTPENLDSRWINFEAGAISKTVEKTYVCTYLFNLKPSEIEGPLSQFNHTKADKDDTRKLLLTVNRALEERALGESIIDDAFNLYWTRLEKVLNELPQPIHERKPTRSIDAMIEEILELVRNTAKVEKSSFPGNISKRRLITTIGWPPEDEQLLSEHIVVAKYTCDYIFGDDNIRRHLSLLGTDDDYALKTLRRLRQLMETQPLIDIPDFVSTLLKEYDPNLPF